MERHLCLVEHLAALAVIAAPAGADEVVPGVLATAVTRHNVVDGEILAPDPAILAGVIVAEKDLAAS